MAHVHEKCLVRWLTQQNTRTCELCKNRFIFEEEFCAPLEIIRRTLRYLTQDKKRIILAGLYMVYLFLFGKRFIQVLKYFKDLVIHYFRVLIGKSGIRESARQNTIIRGFLLRLVKTLKFLYSLFIGIQLAYLAYVECIRIKGVFAFVANNSKSIRIRNQPQ